MVHWPNPFESYTWYSGLARDGINKLVQAASHCLPFSQSPPLDDPDKDVLRSQSRPKLCAQQKLQLALLKK